MTANSSKSSRMPHDGPTRSRHGPGATRDCSKFGMRPGGEPHSPSIAGVIPARHRSMLNSTSFLRRLQLDAGNSFGFIEWATSMTKCCRNWSGSRSRRTKRDLSQGVATPTIRRRSETTKSVPIVPNHAVASIAQACRRVAPIVSFERGEGHGGAEEVGGSRIEGPEIRLTCICTISEQTILL